MSARTSACNAGMGVRTACTDERPDLAHRRGGDAEPIGRSAPVAWAATGRLTTTCRRPTRRPRVRSALTPAELDRWWLLFNDPALNALEDEAFRSAPDARTATARVMEARATRDSLVAQTLPTGDLVGGRQRQAHPTPRTSTERLELADPRRRRLRTSATLNFNVSWELDFFGRLAEARKVANGDLAATRFNAEGARATLAASVADNYFQVRGLAIQLADARETARMQGQLQVVAQKKAELGLGPPSDADRVAGDLAQAQSQVANLEAELHAAQRVLLVLIGRGADAVETVPLRTGGDRRPRRHPTRCRAICLPAAPTCARPKRGCSRPPGGDKLAHLAVFPTFTILPGVGLAKTVSPGVNFVPPASLIPAEITNDTAPLVAGRGRVAAGARHPPPEGGHAHSRTRAPNRR